MGVRRLDLKPLLAGGLVVLGLIVCVAAAWRPWVPGSDSFYYEGFFIRLTQGDFGGRYELGFRYFSRAVALVTSDVRAYFAIVCAVILCLYAYFVSSFSRFEEKGREALGWMFCTLGMLLLSSWFQVATTNGLRQGIALSLNYVAISFILKRRLVPWLLFSIVAVLFHKTSLLVFGASTLLLLPSIIVRVVAAGLALVYLGGGSELLFATLIDRVGLGESFGLDTPEYAVDAWYGFSWVVFGYSVAWAVVIICYEFVSRRGGIGLSFNSRLLDTYFVLLVPYFMFGFASYSNRYAYMAWLLLPFVQARMIWGLPLSFGLRFMVSICLALLAIPIFILRVYS